MSYSQAGHLITTLERVGFPLPPGAKVLDFGCGSGGLVYEFRDRGFDAYGFDQHERVAYRSASDRSFFGFSSNGTGDTSNQILADNYSIPFPEGFFDAVVSTSVIEHVMDLATVNTEIARVLKPTGVAIHTYPSRFLPVEPHVYVPLGGLIHSWPWFMLWALLGVRNQNQETAGYNARQTADNNQLYYRTGLKYLPRRKLHQLLGKEFHVVRDATAEHWRGHLISPFWSRVRGAMKDRYPLRAFSLTQTVSVVVSADKRRSTSAVSVAPDRVERVA
jgi:SAM-dependent methyltransferase